MSFYSDKHKSKFVGKAMSAVPSNSDGKDMYMLLEDPSTVGFNIHFITGKSATDTNNNMLDFCPKRGLLADENGAAEYLKNTGENERVLALSSFIDLLKQMEEHQWTFTSVSGLDKLYQFTEGNSSRLGERGVDITITMYENLEHRCKALADLYREIAWDFKNNRYALPVNMRKFDMDIVVFEYKSMDVRGLVAEMLKKKIERAESVTGDEANRLANNNLVTNNQTIEETSSIKQTLEKAQQGIGNFVNGGIGGINKAEEWLASNEFFKGSKVSSMATNKLESAKAGLMQIRSLAGANKNTNDSQQYPLDSFLPIHVYKLVDCEFKFLETVDKWISSIDNKEGTDVNEYEMVINVGNVEIFNSYPTLFGTVGRTNSADPSTEVFTNASTIANDISAKIFPSIDAYVSAEKELADKKLALNAVDTTILGRLKDFGLRAGRQAMDSLLNVSFIGSTIDTEYLKSMEDEFVAKQKILESLEDLVKMFNTSYDYDGAMDDSTKKSEYYKKINRGKDIKSLYDMDIMSSIAKLENATSFENALDNIEEIKSYINKKKAEIGDVEFNEFMQQVVPYDVELTEASSIKGINGIELNVPNIDKTINPIELKELEIAAGITDVELNDEYSKAAITDVELKENYSSDTILPIELKGKYKPGDISDVELKNEYTPGDIKDVELKENYTPIAVKDVELKENYTPGAVKDVELKNEYTPGNIKDVELKENYSSGTVKDVELKENYSPSEVKDVELKENYTPIAVKDVELKENYVPGAVKDVSFKIDNTKKGIMPINLKENKQNTSISQIEIKPAQNSSIIKDVSLTQPEVKNELMNIEINDNYVMAKPESNVVLKTEYAGGKIANVEFVSDIDKKEVQQIEMKSPDIVKGISDIDLTEDLTKYEAPSEIDLDEPDKKEQILQVKDSYDGRKKKYNKQQ